MVADPADTPGRGACHQGIRKDVSCHDRASSHQSPLPHFDPAEHDGTSADRCSDTSMHANHFPITPRLERPVSFHRPGKTVVGEYHRRPHKHAILQHSRGIKECVVLYFAIRPEHDSGINIDAPANDAVVANHSALTHLSQVPDLGRFGYVGALIHIC